MLVIRIKAGAMDDSNMPRSTRVATSPAKLEMADVTATAIPQRITMEAKYFPVGSFCISQPWGGSQNRNAM